MKKNSEIKIVQKDLIEDIETLVYQGQASLLLGQGISINYVEDDSTNVKITLSDSKGSITRIGETETRISLDLTRPSEATFTSEYGVIKIDVKTDEITLNKDNWVIGYSLFQEKQVISQFIMKVECIDE